jgi:anti-anti-sigma factor
LEINIQSEGTIAIVSIAGRVDTLSAPDFEKSLSAAVKREETLFVLDLAGLEYISSAGLRVILSAGKTLKQRGGELRLAAPKGSVKKVFQVSGFFSLFRCFDTRDAAKESAQ